MDGRSKGAWLGAVSIVTISLWWAAAAETHSDYSCVHWDPAPADSIAWIGIMAGIPCAIFVGAPLGRAAERTRRHRHVLVVFAAALLASVLTLIGRIGMECSTDPSTSTLWLRAFLPLAIASSVLERWTRPHEPVPRATAL